MVIWGTVFYVSNIFIHYPFLDMTMSPVAIAIINTASVQQLYVYCLDLFRRLRS